MSDEQNSPETDNSGYGGDIKLSRAVLDMVELVQSVVDIQLCTVEALMRLGAAGPELSNITANFGTTNKLIREIVANVRSDLERDSHGK